MLVCKGRNNISNIKNNSCPQDLRVPEHFWHLQCGSSASVHPRYQVSRQVCVGIRVGRLGRPEPFNVGEVCGWMVIAFTIFFLEFGWFKV